MRQKLLEKYEKELNEFQEWIKTQPNLPQNIGKHTLTESLAKKFGLENPIVLFKYQH
jgi:hypothetical protein